MGLNKFINSVKSIAPIVNAKKNILSSVLLSNLPKDLIENKCLIIPKDLIENELRAVIDDKGSVKVKSISCKEDQIIIELSVKKSGAEIDINLPVSIVDGVLSKEKQTISLSISDKKSLVGTNIIGKIAAVLVKIFVNDIVKSGISYAGLEEVSNYDPEKKIIEFNLKDLEYIKKFSQPVKNLNLCVFDIVSLNISHHPKGVKLSSKFTSDRSAI